MSSGRGVSPEPRIATAPLRPLNRHTSLGFDIIEWAKRGVHTPFDPWQEWLLIHAGELLPDGRPRFRKVLVMVARQNGKTHIPVVLSTYWLFVEAVPLILGTSTKLEYARETWQKTIDMVERTDSLDGMHPRRWTREQPGFAYCWTNDKARYKIAASNGNAGRSLTINRLIADELRQHKNYDAWDAAIPAMNAVPDAQAWLLSNAGDDTSVVLNDVRDGALEFIETGRGDERFGLFEWSCPDDSDPEDPAALALANPNLGRRLDLDSLLGDARRAVLKGGEALTGFQTEYMCQHVKRLNPAVDGYAWRECFMPGSMTALKKRAAWCLDISPDHQHATLAAAAVTDDGRVRGEVVKAWNNMRELRMELPRLLDKARPQAFGWMPSGPAAALTADLRAKNRTGYPPPGVTVEEIRADLPAICMGLAELVKARQVLHPNDPLLNAHVTAAEKLIRGDVWVFSRKGEGHCDAAYALAGAVHLARTLPKPIGKPRLIVAS
jgi:Phage Terminase